MNTTTQSPVDAVLGQGTTPLDPKRQATKADAEALARAYTTIKAADKAHKTAVREYRQSLAVFSPNMDLTSKGDAVQATGIKLTGVLLEQRRIISMLPVGTTGPGGANRQTLVLEFYGQVNRDLKARISPTDARKINVAAWGD